MSLSPARAQRSTDDIHVPFLLSSLLFGALGGFTLAISLPFEALAGSVDVSWVAHAQVHGHLQTIGFAGLFVIGMSFRLAPRFGGRREMALLGIERWVLVFIAGGLLARALGQPLADDHAAFAALMVGGAAAEATGAVLYCAMMTLTLKGALPRLAPDAVLLTAASVGLVAQAVLGLWWLAELASVQGVLLAAREGAALLHLQLFGFLLPAILGVGMRSFPRLFGRPEPGRIGSGVATLLVLLGAVTWVSADLAGAMVGSVPRLWAVLGQALTGGGVIAAVLMFGPWKGANRLAAASKSLAWAIQPAVLWLAATGVLLLGTALLAAIEGRSVSPVTLDAVRHIFAVGVITLAIVGMAQLILPEFASERLTHSPGAWRGPTFGIALSVAAALRGLVPLLGGEGDARWIAMGSAGVVSWLVVVVFAGLFWRASRSHRAYVARIARHRESGTPLTPAPVEGPSRRE